MLDLFAIFSKGGIVLWYFQSTNGLFVPAVNSLIKSVVLQQRGVSVNFDYESLTLKYKLDNEYDLICVLAYQKVLQLSYVDKLLTDVHLKFRDLYKDELEQRGARGSYGNFSSIFDEMLSAAARSSQLAATSGAGAVKMRSYEESDKSKKTMRSMMLEQTQKQSAANGKCKGGEAETKAAAKQAEKPVEKPPPVRDSKVAATSAPVLTERNGLSSGSGSDDAPDPTELARAKFAERNKLSKTSKPLDKPTDKDKKKKVKADRVWDNCGHSTKGIDYSKEADRAPHNGHVEADAEVGDEEKRWVGQMRGDLPDFKSEATVEAAADEASDEEAEQEQAPKAQGGGWGMLKFFKSLVGSKTLTRSDLEPVLAKMEAHLIAKNVAADVALKICDSVASRLDGQVVGTFRAVSTVVKQAMHDACLQVLSPRMRVNILRDALDAQQKRQPYVVVFCGVNGVGKSTNLAKVAFWLIDNGLRVLIAGCDTFRAGAVEQLRTHCRRLDALFPAEKNGGKAMVHLHERGYGKDPAGIAMEAVNYARSYGFDVVLVDTAGRMQDNEPLMKSLAKLITVNQPHLVLFVGEALVGNEAVDQLKKFNQALADHSNDQKPHLIDGIVLTKFDTIDDKVGAAVSMTYITGQPIMFVGTGQTYKHLTNLNANAVVQSLMK